MSEWVKDDVRLHGSEAFSELAETDLSISIEIEPSHDGDQLILETLVAHLLKKPSEGLFIDYSDIRSVYCLEAVAHVEALEPLKFLLELLESELELDFPRDQESKIAFHHGLEVLVAKSSA